MSPTPPPTPSPSSVAVEYPYLIEVNKVAQVVTVYTIDEQGLYTIPVKRMICSTGVEDEEFPEGVYPLREKMCIRDRILIRRRVFHE